MNIRIFGYNKKELLIVLVRSVVYMKIVVVIGGGIMGFFIMFYLEKLKKDYNIDLNLIFIEKEEYLGGKIYSVEEKDFIMELGVDLIVVCNEYVMLFVKDLNLEDEMVYNEIGIFYIYFENMLYLIFFDIIFGILMSV